ncbi:MAG: uroporphyrinogen decarboxylase family protein [Limnochordia bacterium]
MKSRERALAALNHQEPDRVPFDLGSCTGTNIAVKAYRALRDYLRLPEREVRLRSRTGQLALADEDLLEALAVDARGVVPQPPSNYQVVLEEDDDYWKLRDEWGIGWRMPKVGGFYFDMYDHPLAHQYNVDLDAYNWPKGSDPARIAGLRQQAIAYREAGYLVCFGGTIGNGFLHTGTHLEGFVDFFTDLALGTPRAEGILDRVLEIKLDFWGQVLDNLGDVVDVVCEQDDLGSQRGPFISPDMYRKYIKPRQQILFDFIKKKAPVKLYFHSCGSVYQFIPDLIEVGVDILNPIQVSAAEMCTRRLKKEFGRDLVFWGGGVDTQEILPYGTPQQVKDEVKRRLDDLAPGGGFVFATVHNIQADVPPENVMAMWEALQEYGVY